MGQTLSTCHCGQWFTTKKNNLRRRLRRADTERVGQEFEQAIQAYGPKVLIPHRSARSGLLHKEAAMNKQSLNQLNRRGSAISGQLSELAIEDVQKMRRESNVSSSVSTGHFSRNTSIKTQGSSQQRPINLSMVDIEASSNRPVRPRHSSVTNSERAFETIDMQSCRKDSLMPPMPKLSVTCASSDNVISHPSRGASPSTVSCTRQASASPTVHKTSSQVDALRFNRKDNIRRNKTMIEGVAHRRMPPKWTPRSKHNQSVVLSRNTQQRIPPRISGSVDKNGGLTTAQAHMVKQCWRQVYQTKGASTLGCEMMQRVFFKTPALRLAMERSPRSEKFASSDQLLKWHYRTLADVCDFMISKLDNLAEVAPILQQIGHAHSPYYNYNVRSNLWNTLAEAFIDLTMEWGDKSKRTDDMRKAWAIVISFMAEHFKQGMTEGRRASLISNGSALKLLQTHQASLPPNPAVVTTEHQIGQLTAGVVELSNTIYSDHAEAEADR